MTWARDRFCGNDWVRRYGVTRISGSWWELGRLRRKLGAFPIIIPVERTEGRLRIRIKARHGKWQR